MWFRTEESGDPRHRVTETGFRVDPDLLGHPLAHPGRRLAALLVDLAAVGGLALSRVISPWFFALVGGWLLWRVADPDADVRLPSARLRKLFRAAAVGIGGTALVVLVAGLFDGEREPSPPSSAPVTGVSDRASVAGDSAAGDSAADVLARELAGGESLETGELVRTLRRLRRASVADSAAVPAAGLALELYRAGMSRDEVRDRIEELVEEAAEGDGGVSWAGEAEAIVVRALARLDSAAARRRAVRDSLLGVLAAAADTGARDRIPEVATRLLGVPPRPEVRQLQARVEELEDELEEARQPPSLVATAWGLMNDLGLGLGWLGVYFTAFLALWRGRTPGKKLLGIRVARIDGREIDTWTAFTRFGGYAACVITGLLGFVQILWHPNRQGLHDRVAGTVVIEE